ncbi:MAG: hypothetical protein KTV77_03245 [Wolbachia endosymbiont of Fragariocoptes setiger]|nr:hypothetical protein [Wolbachia endosymbiont of Fragariocoptes setiger]
MSKYINNCDDEIFYGKIKEETSGNIKELVDLKEIEKTTQESIELSNKIEDEVSENLTLLLEKVTEMYSSTEGDERKHKGFNALKHLFQLFLSNDEYHEVEKLLMSHENKRKNFLAEMVRFFKLLLNKVFHPQLKLNFNETLLKEIDKLLEKLKVAGLSKDEIFKIGQKLRTLSLFLVITSMMGLIVTSLSSFITKIVDSLKLDVVKNENYVNMSSERLEEEKVNEQSLYNQRYNMINGTNIEYNLVAGIIVISAHAGRIANLGRPREETIPPIIKLKSAKVPLHPAEQMIKKFPQDKKFEGKPNVDNNKSTAKSERREENSKSGNREVDGKERRGSSNFSTQENRCATRVKAFNIPMQNEKNTLTDLLNGLDIGSKRVDLPNHATAVSTQLNDKDIRLQNGLQSYARI